MKATLLYRARNKRALRACRRPFVAAGRRRLPKRLLLVWAGEREHIGRHERVPVFTVGKRQWLRSGPATLARIYFPQ